MAMAGAGLEVFQWGRETVKGTAIAATSKQPLRIVFSEAGEVFNPPLMKGLTVANRGEDVTLYAQQDWTVDGPVIFEQLPHWLSMAIAPASAPTGVGPYTHVYTRNPAAAPDISTWTLERQLATAQANEWAYSFLRTLNFNAAQNAALMMRAEGSSRAIQTSTLTPALSFPTGMEIPPFCSSKVWINDSWANLGTTALAGTVIGWEFSYTTGWYPFYSADQRADRDLVRAEFDYEQNLISCRIRMLVEAAGGQFATEKTAAAARALRAIRIQATGSSNRSLQLDFLAKHLRPHLPEVEVAQGVNAVNLELVGGTDLTNFFVATVINNISTIPT